MVIQKLGKDNAYQVFRFADLVENDPEGELKLAPGTYHKIFPYTEDENGIRQENHLGAVLISDEELAELVRMSSVYRNILMVAMICQSSGCRPIMTIGPMLVRLCSFRYPGTSQSALEKRMRRGRIRSYLELRGQSPRGQQDH